MSDISNLLKAQVVCVVGLPSVRDKISTDKSKVVTIHLVLPSRLSLNFVTL